MKIKNKFIVLTLVGTLFLSSGRINAFFYKSKQVESFASKILSKKAFGCSLLAIGTAVTLYFLAKKLKNNRNNVNSDDNNINNPGQAEEKLLRSV